MMVSRVGDGFEAAKDWLPDDLSHPIASVVGNIEHGVEMLRRHCSIYPGVKQYLASCKREFPRHDIDAYLRKARASMPTWHIRHCGNQLEIMPYSPLDTVVARSLEIVQSLDEESRKRFIGIIVYGITARMRVASMTSFIGNKLFDVLFENSLRIEVGKGKRSFWSCLANAELGHFLIVLLASQRTHMDSVIMAAVEATLGKPMPIAGPNDLDPGLQQRCRELLRGSKKIQSSALESSSDHIKMLIREWIPKLCQDDTEMTKRIKRTLGQWDGYDFRSREPLFHGSNESEYLERLSKQVVHYRRLSKRASDVEVETQALVKELENLKTSLQEAVNSSETPEPAKQEPDPKSEYDVIDRADVCLPKEKSVL